MSGQNINVINVVHALSFICPIFGEKYLEIHKNMEVQKASIFSVLQ